MKVKGEKTDLWALGVTLFYITSGNYPFNPKNNNIMHLKELIVEKDINFELIKHDGIR